ncbi:DUF4917 family protein [Glycomyces albus]
MNGDIKVEDWEKIPATEEFKSILIGNGFSVGLHEEFRYESLLKEADFNQKILKVFSDLNTNDFEVALESLNRADQVLKALDKATPEIQGAYAEIRSKLFNTVRSLHPPHRHIGDETFINIHEILHDYDKIFTTNYDVLLYWATLAQSSSKAHVDYFYKTYNTFDYEVSHRRAWRSMYYLHGAVHLWHDPLTGTTGKHVSNGDLLLDVIEQQIPDWPNAQPLFVSEGDPQRKVESIRRSVYLSIALDELTLCNESIVVFGFGFGDSDNHIFNAVCRKNTYNRRRIAIAQYMPNAGHDNAAHRIKLKGKLEDQGNQVIFFDSATHPLGRILGQQTSASGLTP